ncbi:Gfo/Idh/MocA family oxidoreductase [Nonomuraea sp. NPDC052129]|uniref:Gfo/Idh/MocA family oxidoreductase n=1 Tax=Nonomuraea sp. NPDC052129 TaxID=3154651 RepID=UPI00342E375C
MSIVAVADMDAERARRFAVAWHIPARYDRLDALLAAERPDLLVVRTPPGYHVEAIHAGWRNGAWSGARNRPPCRWPVTTRRRGENATKARSSSTSSSNGSVEDVAGDGDEAVAADVALHLDWLADRDDLMAAGPC